MRITKWGEYGILCCLYLARKGLDACVGASEIAEHELIPLQYTQQILQRLRKGGVIASVRGPGGGYRIARTPEKISVKQILDAAEGFTFQVMCEVRSGDCQNFPDCPLRLIWCELRQNIDKLLTEKTLATLLLSESEIKSSASKKLATTV